MYQKVSFDAGRIDHILIKPPEALTSRLNQSFMQESAVAAQMAIDWTHVHAMAFGSVDAPLRECFNFLDEKISEIVRTIKSQARPIRKFADIFSQFSRVMISGVEPGKLRESDTLENSSRDMKSLQAFVDMALRVKHSIDVNLETLESMEQLTRQLRGRQPSSDSSHIDSLLCSLNKMRQQHHLSIKNFASMIERARSLSEQVRLFGSEQPFSCSQTGLSFETPSRFAIVRPLLSSR